MLQDVAGNGAATVCSVNVIHIKRKGAGERLMWGGRNISHQPRAIETHLNTTALPAASEVVEDARNKPFDVHRNRMHALP